MLAVKRMFIPRPHPERARAIQLRIGIFGLR